MAREAERLGGESGRTGSIRGFLDYIRDKPRVRLGLIIGPPLLVLVGFFVLPIVSIGFLSFSPPQQTNILPGGRVTLENYARAFTQSVYLDVLWRTTVITVQTTAIVVAIGYTMAYSIVRFSRRTSLLLLLVILPFWTNYIIRMYAWINILQKGGVLSSILEIVGAVQGEVGYLFTWQAVLIGFVYVWLPLATLPFYATLANMDEDLIEAAKDLGAGPIKTFLTVTLPLTKGGLIAGTILVAIPTFGSFITPRLLGGTNVVMIGVVIEEQFGSAFNWPFGAALSMLVTVLVVALLIGGVRAGGSLYGMGGD
ncbi:ABC transporter permease [Halobacteriales archaeon QS_5_70_15]|nr:MAG: ABC transporter permease [Halobacteriales archaeon QS_5_70_15]